MKHLIILFTVCFSLPFLYAEEDISYDFVSANENTAIYEKWTQETINAFRSIVSQKKLPLKLKIYITSKTKNWPRAHIFYHESFFADQRVTIKGNQFVFNPISDAPGLQNNEFTFKEGFASLLIKKHYGNKIPVWAKEGLPILLAQEAGAKDWISRNFTYYILLSSEMNEHETIANVLKFKHQIDNKKRYSQRCYAWAFVKWLVDSKQEIDTIEKIFTAKETQEIETILKDKNLEEKWFAVIQKIHESILPYRINIHPSYEKKLTADEITTFFLKVKKEQKSPSHEAFRNFFGSEINSTTYEALISLLTAEQHEIREYTAYTLGLIADRSALPSLIEMASKDEFPETRKRAAISIKEINMSYTPQALINNLNLNEAQHVANTAEAIGLIGDRVQARALIQKMNTIGSPNGYIAIGTTQNYVSDYDVVDGVYKPVIKTFTDGVVLETKVLWVTIVQPKIITALNNLPLAHTSQNPQEWYKWFNDQ